MYILVTTNNTDCNDENIDWWYIISVQSYMRWFQENYNPEFHHSGRHEPYALKQMAEFAGKNSQFLTKNRGVKFEITTVGGVKQAYQWCKSTQEHLDCLPTP